MTVKELNKFKELSCVIWGHDFGMNYHQREIDTDFVLEHHATCLNCGISIIDQSGMLKRYQEKNFTP